MLIRMWRRFESRSRLFFRRSDGFDILVVTRCEAKTKTDLGGEVKKRKRGTPRRRGKAGAATRDGKTGRRTWNGYEKGIRFDFRFVSKTIKWLTPIGNGRNDMVWKIKKFAILPYIYTCINMKANTIKDPPWQVAKLKKKYIYIYIIKTTINNLNITKLA